MRSIFFQKSFSDVHWNPELLETSPDIKQTLPYQLAHPSNVQLSPCSTTTGNCLEKSQRADGCAADTPFQSIHSLLDQFSAGYVFYHVQPPALCLMGKPLAETKQIIPPHDNASDSVVLFVRCAKN